LPDTDDAAQVLALNEDDDPFVIVPFHKWVNGLKHQYSHIKKSKVKRSLDSVYIEFTDDGGLDPAHYEKFLRNGYAVAKTGANWVRLKKIVER
jgi:hypothetical protein